MPKPPREPLDIPPEDDLPPIEADLAEEVASGPGVGRRMLNEAGDAAGHAGQGCLYGIGDGCASGCVTYILEQIGCSAAVLLIAAAAAAAAFAR